MASKLSRLIRAIRDPTRLINAYAALMKDGYPLHKSEGFQPFFIVGAKRSGNTLLRRLLISKKVHISPEIWCTKNVFDSHRRFSTLGDWGFLVRGIITEMAVRSQCTDDFKEQILNVIEKAEKIPAEQRSLAAIINQFHVENGRFAGHDTPFRWGEKAPANVFALKQINQIFPDARYIHLVRDGVDAAKTWTDRGLIGGETIEEAAESWVHYVQTVEKFEERYPGKVMQAKYEYLVRNPKKCLKEICQFLHIPVGLEEPATDFMGDVKQYNHYENASNDITDKYVGKGRRALNNAEKSKIRPILNEKLMSLGYDPI